jgi:hypothetical protein
MRDVTIDGVSRHICWETESQTDEHCFEVDCLAEITRSDQLCIECDLGS